jgi:lon-related putative ATP-dependent protease
MQPLGKDNIRELSPEELLPGAPSLQIDFEQPAVYDLTAAQKRAVSAIEFGLKLKAEQFNIFVAGQPGVGRSTEIKNAVEKIAQGEPVPDDICYVFNFDKKDEPKMLKLPHGMGCALKKDMDKLVEETETEIQKAFSSESYEKSRAGLINQMEDEEKKLQNELNEFATKKGYVIKQTLTGLMVVPMSQGREIGEEQYQALPPDRKKQIDQDTREISEKFQEVSRRARQLRKDAGQKLKELDQKIGLGAIGHLVDELQKKYQQLTHVLNYLEEIKKDILENLDVFKRPEREAENILALGLSREEKIRKYTLNLLVDNCQTKGAPIVMEHNPTYYNLIGRIEYRAQLGMLNTDFSMIKAGAVHKAAGGYLVLEAKELFKDYFAWEALKRILKFKMAKIENLEQRLGFVPTFGLRPEPVPVDLKVIIIGEPLVYYLLYSLDPDFRDLFKVKAEFDSVMKKTDQTIGQYINFMVCKSKEENLLPFDKEAVRLLLEHSSRLAGHQEKLSIRFTQLISRMKEANYWAQSAGSKAVGAEHITKALEEAEYRSNMIEEKIREMIEENTIVIDTEGSQRGQVNGISVISLGDYMFGRPSRITAATYVGDANIINIEREAKMSGKIHSKGVLILTGYLGQYFAQDKPLSLSASLCFEQSYEEVEGDSASSAELYCLLSSLSGLPLRQDLAVTGSVDQLGKVQAIGGINHKIEGFYRVCKVKGLTGKQGVIMPAANVKHLVLKNEIVEAVRNKKFHIYAVESIAQGISILTGQPAQDVFDKVDKKLQEFSKVSASFRRPKPSSDKPEE